MLWIPVSLYLFIKMVVNTAFRDLTFKKLLAIKDRDERESVIAGNAAVISMLSTSALTVLLLFLSVLTISIGEDPDALVSQGDKKHFISIGFDPIPKNKTTSPESPYGTTKSFNYSGIPVPPSVILFLILGWQLVTFHLTVRKSLKE